MGLIIIVVGVAFISFLIGRRHGQICSLAWVCRRAIGSEAYVIMRIAEADRDHITNGSWLRRQWLLAFVGQFNEE